LLHALGCVFDLLRIRHVDWQHQRFPAHLLDLALGGI
jgi:hypothetical protein